MSVVCSISGTLQLVLLYLALPRLILNLRPNPTPHSHTHTHVLTHSPSLSMIKLQPVGCKTPGTGMEIAHTKLRGVESAGMICSAQDLGWASGAEGEAARVPPGLLPGEPIPEEEPAQVQGCAACLHPGHGTNDAHN